MSSDIDTPTDARPSATNHEQSADNEDAADEEPESPTMDYVLYSGDIRALDDLDFIEYLGETQEAENIFLILCTFGGSADAAYKIGGYIQSAYKSFKLFIPGYCKSAGTLLAVAAEEIIFDFYGELGPLDVQLVRTDSIVGRRSSLNIHEAFLALEGRAAQTFSRLILDITRRSGGAVSFTTASKSAADIVSALYGPIFAQIEPEEVGSRSRAMRIVEDYGERLNEKFGNLKPDALARLSQSYASHEFVIDQDEASHRFKNVREATELEKRLVGEIGAKCRIPHPDLDPYFANVTNTYKELSEQQSENEDSNG